MIFWISQRPYQILNPRLCHQWHPLFCLHVYIWAPEAYNAQKGLRECQNHRNLNYKWLWAMMWVQDWNRNPLWEPLTAISLQPLDCDQGSRIVQPNIIGQAVNLHIYQMTIVDLVANQTLIDLQRRSRGAQALTSYFSSFSFYLAFTCR